MAKRPVPIHPSSGEGPRGRRTLAVRATCSPEEKAFFERVQRESRAPAMGDLLRYAVAKIAIEHGCELPEKWAPYYEPE